MARGGNIGTGTVIDYESKGCNTAATSYDCKIGGEGCRRAMYRFKVVGAVAGTLCCCKSHLCNRSQTIKFSRQLLLCSLFSFLIRSIL
ncbi:hypothetical protein Tcan_07392 [Toxocara canis]|uniref:Uncharacterized protein n=1 Tax=Toxocara canis TaxID=6265 RepID=A0A0B2W3Z3_TOXCA|nr:hypothetical protein Tcan_07392 [Toxocara canis]